MKATNHNRRPARRWLGARALVLLAAAAFLSNEATLVAAEPGARPGMPPTGHQTVQPQAAGMKTARLQQLQGLVDSKDWLKDPFRYLATDMVDVIDDLGEGKTHTPAQVTEPKVISRLDVLIEMLKKQCSGGGGGRPNSPLRRSILAHGPGGIGDLNAPRNSRRKWAELTAKERERIMQSRTEGFPPGYEEILGEYYRRLATEDSVRAIAPSGARTGGDKAAAGKPAAENSR